MFCFLTWYFGHPDGSLWLLTLKHTCVSLTCYSHSIIAQIMPLDHKKAYTGIEMTDLCRCMHVSECMHLFIP
jgi:hypothetical protein